MAYKATKKYNDDLSKEKPMVLDDIRKTSIELQNELSDIPTGNKKWKQYQDLCKKILEYSLYPCFSNIKIEEEVWDDYGTSRVDLTMVNDWKQNRAHSFWSNMYNKFNVEKLFIECKNTSTFITNKEVRQSLSYDGVTAGSLRILISRKGFNDKGLKILKARRTGYFQVLMLVLNDQDMHNLIKTRVEKTPPEKILLEIKNKIEKGM